MDDTCYHGNKRHLCRHVRHTATGDFAVVSGLNFHGVGEFIALYPDGDMSSEEIKDYEPTCNDWETLDRLLTP